MDTEVNPGLDMPVLEQVRPPGLRSWTLERDRLTIGRDTCSDVGLDDPAVSRHHASLVRRGLGWTVVDEASTNGTFINGTRIRHAALHAGDRIGIGGTELVLRWPGGPTPSPRSQGAARYDVGSQSGNINNVAGNQSNFNQANQFGESNLRYIASRRGRARRLIVSGVALFFVGWAIGLFTVVSFQMSMINAMNSDSNLDSFQQSDAPPAFFPLGVGAGMFLMMLGMALFVFGLIARSGAKRDADRMGAPW